MHTVQQLVFAQHFPFSGKARHIVKEENLSLEGLPPGVVERAELMAKHAFAGKKYLFELHSSDLLLQEILAFPVAKIIVSLAGEPFLYQRFSAMVADSGYDFLIGAKDKGKASIELASDLGIKFDFPESKEFFVSISLEEFLSIPFKDSSLKLVNQFVSNGIVSLDQNGFCRFLKEKAYSSILSSLPVSAKGLPKNLEAIASRLKKASREREKKVFETAFKGKLAPDAFPPCIAQMYGQLASGQKLPHMANFSLATFLNSVGMPKQQILSLFRKSPNFKERIASYQLDRIAKQDYAPPSCEKIKGYGLCPNTDCRVKHPLSFYRRKLRQKGTQKASEKKKEAKDNAGEKEGKGNASEKEGKAAKEVKK